MIVSCFVSGCISQLVAGVTSEYRCYGSEQTLTFFGQALICVGHTDATYGGVGVSEQWHFVLNCWAKLRKCQHFPILKLLWPLCVLFDRRILTH